MHGAAARRGGHHAQHVGRDVEAREREQARRQTPRRGGVDCSEAREEAIDRLRTMREPARGAPPELGLPVVAIGAAIPCEQPVATPCLIFREYVGERIRERPGLEIAIGSVEKPVERGRDRRMRTRGGVVQHRIETPDEPRRIERARVVVLGHVRGEHFGDELARREEAKIRRDAVTLGKRRLQPAPHRRLRDQDCVGLEQACTGRRRAELLGEEAGEHVECVAVVEAEVGCGGHR